MLITGSGGLSHENARGEGQGKGAGAEEYLRTVEDGIDPDDSEGRRKFRLFWNRNGLLRPVSLLLQGRLPQALPTMSQEFFPQQIAGEGLILPGCALQRRHPIKTRYDHSETVHRSRPRADNPVHSIHPAVRKATIQTVIPEYNWQSSKK